MFFKHNGNLKEILQFIQMLHENSPSTMPVFPSFLLLYKMRDCWVEAINHFWAFWFLLWISGDNFLYLKLAIYEFSTVSIWGTHQKIQKYYCLNATRKIAELFAKNWNADRNYTFTINFYSCTKHWREIEAIIFHYGILTLLHV